MRRTEKTRLRMRHVQFPTLSPTQIVPDELDANILRCSAMDVDSKKPTRPQITKKRIEKKRKKSSITFPKYSDRLAARKKKNAPKKA